MTTEPDRVNVGLGGDMLSRIAVNAGKRPHLELERTVQVGALGKHLLTTSKGNYCFLQIVWKEYGCLSALFHATS